MRIPRREAEKTMDLAIENAARAVARRSPIIGALAMMADLHGIFGMFAPMMSRRERKFADAMLGGVKDVTVEKTLDFIEDPLLKAHFGEP